MDKQKLWNNTEEYSDTIITISDKIWEYSELSMQEYKSTAAYIEALKSEGFTVEKTSAGYPPHFQAHTETAELR